MKISFWWSYVFPVLLGSIAGMFIYWAFDDFPKMPTIYFAKLFLKSIWVPLIVVLTLRKNRKKSE